MLEKEAVQFLRDRGYKLTPQRVEILRALMEVPEPITAQDVRERVQSAFPYVSLDTVYRNLTMLTETGLVNQVNLQNKGIARFEFQGRAHHHHFVCLQCSKNFCVDSCPLPTPFPLPTEDPGFVVVSHAFEVYGYCTECQATASTHQMAE